MIVDLVDFVVLNLVLVGFSFWLELLWWLIGFDVVCFVWLLEWEFVSV